MHLSSLKGPNRKVSSEGKVPRYSRARNEARDNVRVLKYLDPWRRWHFLRFLQATPCLVVGKQSNK